MSSRPLPLRSDARTVREAREAIRDVEAAVECIHMAAANALAPYSGSSWYLRKARLALRQAERSFAKADDPRLEPLAPMRAQIRDRGPLSRPPRKRYRCPLCFHEALRADEDGRECYRRSCDGVVEPVAKLRRAK